jgi:DNA-binding SARP family transcriptional activator/ABC-type transport system substrate-binding protein/outer membrane protein assembly factor BamB
VEFRLLGPLEVWDDGRALELGGQKRRALLALLLLHANEVVSSDRLIEELWGEEPPQAAATALHGHVSRLRKLLGCADGSAEQLLVTRPPGYVLQVEPDQLDLHRFECLREEARAARSKGDLADASAKLRDALTLWRGPPLADLAYERFAQVECGRLEQLRLATIEERIEADLALGRHGDVCSELERLVAEHPLREGFRAQLMLALYRSGRQAEALQVYRQGRRMLVEELGIDPSQRLRDLEQAILRQDESLGPPVVPSAPEVEERRNRRPLLLISAVCAIGGAVALGLLVSRLEGGKAAAFRAGTVLLDSKTKKQIGFVRTSRLLTPAAPVYRRGHVWLLNAPSSNSFVELDANTGNVLRQFPLPNGFQQSRAVQPFAFGKHALWVAAGDDLVKMDPRIGQEVDRFNLDRLTRRRGAAEGVAVGGGLVWVGRDVGSASGQVIAVDPRTRQLRYQFSVIHDADLAFDDGIVWAADSGGVAVIDPATKHVTEVRDIETFDPFYGPRSYGNGVAAGGGFGWTTDPAKGDTYKIDRSGRLVDTYHTGQGATGASFGDGAVWVRNPDVGTVSRIDPDTRRQTVYRFGHSVAAAVAGNGVLLAALEQGPTTEERIGSLHGNVLRLFSKQGALGLGREPALDWDLAAGQIYFATCANLLRHPDEPAPDGLLLRPEVAARMPTLSRDRRTYTFTIRRGYRFSPPVNQPLTAETFRYSIKRAVSQQLVPDPSVAPGPSSVGDIKGVTAFRHGKARNIAGLRAAGDQLSITLTRPSPDFLQRLTSPTFCPVPRDTPPLSGAANIRVGANARTIPSAGPYYVADWRDDKYVILKRNPYYRGPRPHKLDAIALREGVDVGVALDRIRHGGWDGIVSSGHTSTQLTDPRLDPGSPLAKKYGKGSPAGLQYVGAPLSHTTYIVLNAVRGPLADPTVRRAIAFAVDRTAIAPIWDSTPTDQLLPKVTGGFRDRRLYPLRPDLAKARALVHGRRLEAVMANTRPTDPGLLEEARLLRAELRPIGIRLEFKPPKGDAADPAADLEDSGLIDGPDGASFLEQVFLTTGSVPRGWLTPAVRQAVETVSRLSGSERQSAAGALADRLLKRDVPLVAIGNRVQGELFAPTVGCRVFPATGAGVDLAALCRKGSG